MRYYEIHCETPFCGEDNYFYIASDNYEEVEAFASECETENGYEWWDTVLEEDGWDEEDYFEQCSSTIKEITKEEYEEYAYGS